MPLGPGCGGLDAGGATSPASGPAPVPSPGTLPAGFTAQARACASRGAGAGEPRGGGCSTLCIQHGERVGEEKTKKRRKIKTRNQKHKGSGETAALPAPTAAAAPAWPSPSLASGPRRGERAPGCRGSPAGAGHQRPALPRAPRSARHSPRAQRWRPAGGRRGAAPPHLVEAVLAVGFRLYLHLHHHRVRPGHIAQHGWGHRERPPPPPPLSPRAEPRTRRPPPPTRGPRSARPAPLAACAPPAPLPPYVPSAAPPRPRPHLRANHEPPLVAAGRRRRQSAPARPRGRVLCSLSGAPRRGRGCALGQLPGPPQRPQRRPAPSASLTRYGPELLSPALGPLKSKHAVLFQVQVKAKPARQG